MSLYAAPGTPPVPSWKFTRTAERERDYHMGLITVDSSGVYHCVHDLRWDDMVPMPASYDSYMRAERRKLARRQR